MGKMVDGRWTNRWYEPDAKGRFVREATAFHGRVGPKGPHQPGHKRYHLYVSLACPWAHRTLIVRALKGLEASIGVTVVDPKMGDEGWAFREDEPDPVLGARFLRHVYLQADQRYTGRITVPVLWDKEAATIVNNESAEIMRILDHEFQELAENADLDLAPPDLVEQVDKVIAEIYAPINDGVYKAGFARSQAAYEEAVTALFEALDHWDGVLGKQKFLCGDRMTEADIALFTTLVRFDPVYYGHFKCNLKHVWEYPNLWRFAREMYADPKIAGTCDFEHIKVHYYWSHETLNPKRIVPVGPVKHVGNAG